MLLFFVSSELQQREYCYSLVDSGSPQKNQNKMEEKVFLFSNQNGSTCECETLKAGLGLFSLILTSAKCFQKRDELIYSGNAKLLSDGRKR